MKELITSGFPRSGNTYLNQALQLMYYPSDLVNDNRHTVVAIEKSKKIMVPFRNPIDCIASWHKYPSSGELELDIKYYIRLYSFVLNNLNKVVLMDFDLFTNDLEYIKTKVFENFGLTTAQNVTDSQIKEAMLTNGRERNLPQNNKEEINTTKAALQTIPEFSQCSDIYQQLKSI
jgi:hypothetical protein